MGLAEETAFNYEWITPVEGRVSSPSGTRTNPVTGNSEFHDGIDIAVPEGTRITAPKDGKVIAAGYSVSYGNYIRISHENGYISFYAHLSRAIAEIGDIVTQGYDIAYSGNTGQSTGPHLHFSIYRDGQFVDPLAYINP